MVPTNIPALLCAICISSYWLTVFIKAILITPEIGKTPNVIPKDLPGLLSRLVMLPLIAFWLFLPWKAAFYQTAAYPVLAWSGVTVCLLAFALTVYCWHYMGDVWRIGIDPAEKNRLLTDGPFKYTRHPIYALSILLMSGTLLGIQTWTAFILFCIHWILFTLEAYREECYLHKIHGNAYSEYARQRNRFLPLPRRMRNLCSYQK